MNIDKTKLIKETIELANYLSDCSMEKIATNYPLYINLNTFIVSNDILGNLTGYCFDYEKILNKDSVNIKVILDNEKEKSINSFNEKIIKEKDLYKKILANYFVIYNNSGLEYTEQKYQEKIFSKSDILEIIYSFYSQYGNDTYLTCKKMIEEERIQMGFKQSDNDSEGFYISSSQLEIGYICLKNNRFDTSTLIYLVHELGHAIDKELFYFPNKKNILLDDTFSEIPSSFFEWEITDYLIKNNIDRKTAISHQEFQLNQLYLRSIYLINILMKKNIKNQTSLTEDTRQLFLYAIGYYLSLAMNNLSNYNPKDYFNYFKKINSIREHCDLNQVIEIAKIDKKSFIEGEILQKKINELILLKK